MRWTLQIIKVQRWVGPSRNLSRETESFQIRPIKTSNSWGGSQNKAGTADKIAIRWPIRRRQKWEPRNFAISINAKRPGMPHRSLLSRLLTGALPRTSMQETTWRDVQTTPSINLRGREGTILTHSVTNARSLGHETSPRATCCPVETIAKRSRDNLIGY